MNRKLVLSALAVTVLGAGAVLAQGQQAPQHAMTFFIASTVPGTGNLGGLAGADRICQNLAAAVGAGNHTWHAYLSQQQNGNEPSVNARGRIGPGPWYNAKGVLIASNNADLHGDQLRDRNNIQKINALEPKFEALSDGAVGHVRNAEMESVAQRAGVRLGPALRRAEPAARATSGADPRLPAAQAGEA